MKTKSSKVYFLSWEKRKNLTKLLEISRLSEILNNRDFIAIKTHFGEKGNHGYIKLDLFKDIINIVKSKKNYPFLTDTNTIYNGQRNNTPNHLMLAHGHGFSFEKTKIPAIIADGLKGNDYKEVKINGTYFKSVKIAQAIYEADSMIVISHFKGHILSGFGGAIKNLGMGCAAKIGKFEIHSGVSPTVNESKCIGCGKCVKICSHEALKIINGKIKLDADKCAGCGECIISCNIGALTLTWSEPSKSFQEKTVEYALGAVKDKKIFYITFINNITTFCDCWSMENPTIAPDIGIITSDDPVAIDQAALDLVIKNTGEDVFKKAHPNINHKTQLEYAEKIGLGSRKYILETVDI